MTTPRPITSPAPEPAVNVGEQERVACAVAGVVVTGLGLFGRNAATPILALLGGLLIKRGVSGHCPAYQALGLDTNVRPEPRVPLM